MKGVCSVLARGSRHALCIVLCLLCFASTLSVRGDIAGAASGVRGTEFTLLTYNIAGLPAVISMSDPARNVRRIGELLNGYDLVVVQEDFVYHGDLTARAWHPYQSSPLGPGLLVGLGDGLNRLSRVPFSSLSRTQWRHCSGRLKNGADCLTPKGFTVATHELAPGISVDLYNLHMDAGESPADAWARRQQTQQLLTHIEEHSTGRPLIVAGDTNLEYGEAKTLSALLAGAGLADACRALSCPHSHLIDRVMYRSSPTVRLEATRFVVDARFVRDDGTDLSDHKPVGVAFQFDERTQGGPDEPIVEAMPESTTPAERAGG